MNSQALPLWERGKASRGHRSAVDGALKAHRQRNFERQQRVQDRIDMMGSFENDFFPMPQRTGPVDNSPLNMNQPMENVANLPEQNTSPVNESLQVQADLVKVDIDNVPQNPRGMEDLYNEAQLGSVRSQALVGVEQEIQNPEKGPVDDVPKGSYIDYEV